MKNTLFVLLVALLLASCQEESNLQLRTYYYPLDKLSGQGLVYCFKSSVSQQDPPFYWHFKTSQEGGKLFLLGVYYDYRFRPFQRIKEEALQNGMLLREFTLYEYDSLGQKHEVEVQIEGGNVFPFLLEDRFDVLYSKLHWQTPLDTTYSTTLIRNRQYAGDTSWTFQGKTHQAVNFYVRELIDVESEGHIEQEYDGMETYASGLGLVFFEKNVSADFQVGYQLDRIITYEAFMGMQKY